MNKKKLEKLISQHDFSLTLFSETDAIVEVAIKSGENSADIETLEEQQEEIEQKIEQVQSNQKWNDQAIDSLYNKVYELESKIDSIEIKEEIEEENNPEIHEQQEEEETETIIEKAEEEVGVEKKSNLALIIGTMIFGAVSVFLIKLYEGRTAGDKEI